MKVEGFSLLCRRGGVVVKIQAGAQLSRALCDAPVAARFGAQRVALVTCVRVARGVRFIFTLGACSRLPKAVRLLCL